MALHVATPGDPTLPVERGDAVVVIPLFGAHDQFARCLRSILAHTPPTVRIVVADDASPDPASLALARSIERSGTLAHDLYWLRQPVNLGFVGNVNVTFDACAPADVLLVNSDVVVAEGWFEGLRDAALSDTTIATATALTNHGTIVSVPRRNSPVPDLPKDRTLDELARAVRERSLRLRPRLPAAIGHCVYVRRVALDLVGGFDEAFAPGYGEEVDFSQRCVLAGMQHVAADDVLVLHHGHASFGVDGAVNPVQLEHELLLRARYAHYEAAVVEAAGDEHGPLARALGVARQALQGVTVTIDARCLGPFMTGTQVHALELIGAVARTGEARLRVVVPEELGDYAREALDGLDRVETIGEAAAREGLSPDAVVHRPFQVSGGQDLPFLWQLGERLVVTHQDLIAYRNPAYFASADAWQRYRRLTSETLAWSSMVLFFSQHAADDALSEDLLPAERARVVHIGVDHQLVSAHPQPSPPPGVPDDLAERGFLVCLGTSFRHKNRVFALRVLEALVERGWGGRLVLAGPNVEHGTSMGEEAEFLAVRPELTERIVELGAVADAVRTWLYMEAAAVLYPTTYEGFGLVPFEAAELGTPCLFAPVTSLPEVLPKVEPVLVPWDAQASADRILAVLGDEKASAKLVRDVRSAAKRLTWDRTAQELLAAYEDALRLPARDVARQEGDRLTLDYRYWDLRGRIGGAGLALVGDDEQEALLDEQAQRALAALASRPATRTALKGALHLVHRAATRGRNGDS